MEEVIRGVAARVGQQGSENGTNVRLMLPFVKHSTAWEGNYRVTVFRRCL